MEFFRKGLKVEAQQIIDADNLQLVTLVELKQVSKNIFSFHDDQVEADCVACLWDWIVVLHRGEEHQSIYVLSDTDFKREYQTQDEIKDLTESRDRISWVSAGVSTAILGALRPEEPYDGKPIEQIEEALRVRMRAEAFDEVIKIIDKTAHTVDQIEAIERVIKRCQNSPTLQSA